MEGQDTQRAHNPVAHEVSLAGWLVGRCLHQTDWWSAASTRGRILLCCGETVEYLGELADELTSQDPEVASAVRHLAELLRARARHLEESGLPSH